MIIKKFKLFELNTFKNLKEDINGILVELNDMGYTVRTYGLYDDGSLSGGDTFSFVITKKYITEFIEGSATFNMYDIKDYLDTCIDYMSIYYNYNIEVGLIQAFCAREEYYDNYELHLDKRLKSFTLVFTNISKK